MSVRAPLAAALALAAFAATAAPALADQRCRPRVLDLGTLPGSERSYAFGVNGAGVAVGLDDDGADFEQTRAVRWVGGRIQDLGLPGPGLAFDINDAGAIVGDYDNNGKSQAFLWRDGRLTNLPGLRGGRGAIARHISETGLVVGTAWDAEDRGHAVVWLVGHIIDLGLPPGYVSGWGFDVTDTGEVVGDVSNETTTTPFRWRLGHFRLLPPLGDFAFGVTFAPGGVTAGNSFQADGRAIATLWDRQGRPRNLGFLGGGDSAEIRGGDSNGGFVGNANLKPGERLPHVFVARAGEPLRTMRTITGALGPSAASGLHRAGYAAGSSAAANGEEHATLWNCVWQQAFVPRAAAEAAPPR